MKKKQQYFVHGLCVAATLLLAACGGSSSATTTTTTSTVSAVTPASTATIGTAVSITVTGANLPLTAVFTLQDGTCDSPTVNSATTITQSCTPGGSAGTKTITVLTASGGTVIDASQTITVAAAFVASLPDTGITDQQCYQAGSDTLISCSSAGAIALNDQQDGMITPGTSGMSYSAVGAYPLTSCVQDNKTGLIWEGKTDDGGLRDKDNTYTNYGDSRAGDASAYVTAVNATSLCGYTDWRLPTADELQMIVDYSIAYPAPTINSTWFPNTVGSAYWSASPYAGYSDYAWVVHFSFGGVNGGGRGNAVYVRLVRAGQ
ncbi:Lcl C-terminal domain-containing protein [Trichlorobacter lovleyi]|uniref:Lcl C-terminal domain-containing protein n=1 Tax=Trichlorobacter lovleyi (strain ATCC BAA-1151 / DSM 17278 / SZ) TaxID=398767 RepID=B3E3H3_TRIL1|nr:DUF1566 domain-containing protein [Trichlorobacter lovleyi]ACD95792.1 protein of unknown function DUF1566 [Trichlorobacter lovleyi SZ]